MGQHVDVSLVEKMRFYGGLQYANIQINATIITLYHSAQRSTSINLYDNTDFKGVGPSIRN